MQPHTDILAKPDRTQKRIDAYKQSHRQTARRRTEQTTETVITEGTDGRAVVEECLIVERMGSNNVASSLLDFFTMRCKRTMDIIKYVQERTGKILDKRTLLMSHTKH